jgi:mannose-6-phosphate isomerase
MPWGGQRLRHWISTPFPADGIGEAWLLSDHPLHHSRVADGPHANATLRQLMEQRGTAILGRPAERFPLLIKLLDARENLSVQVHPDDAAAATWAPGEGGKTEAWLVLEADPGACLYIGLKPGVDRALFAAELARGTAPLCLRRYEPKPGQCYFVPAGVVHAVSGGVVLLEVQQTSDATFRLFDWGRVDAAGKPRPLHVDAGLACLKAAPPGAGLWPAQPGKEPFEELVQCSFFTMARRRLSMPLTVPAGCILVVLDGEVSIGMGAEAVQSERGRAILVPAGNGPVTIAAASGPSADVVVVRWV